MAALAFTAIKLGQCSDNKVLKMRGVTRQYSGIYKLPRITGKIYRYLFQG